MTADFKFDDAATDKAPIEVIITNAELTVPKVMGTVTGLDDYLNMRAEPRYAADTVHQLYNGDQVEIINTVTSEDGAVWYEIIYGGSIKGFSSAEFIVKNDEIKNKAETETAEAENTSDDDEETEDTDEEENSEENYTDEEE